MPLCELDLQLRTIQDIAHSNNPAGIPQLISFHKLGSPVGLEGLLMRTREGDSCAQVDAAEALGLTGSPEVYPHLRAMLDQPNLTGPAVRGLTALLEHGAANLSERNLKDLGQLRDTYLFRYEWYSADYTEVPEIKAMDARPVIGMASAELQRRGILQA